MVDSSAHRLASGFTPFGALLGTRTIELVGYWAKITWVVSATARCSGEVEAMRGFLASLGFSAMLVCLFSTTSCCFRFICCRCCRRSLATRAVRPGPGATEGTSLAAASKRRKASTGGSMFSTSSAASDGPGLASNGVSSSEADSPSSDGVAVSASRRRRVSSSVRNRPILTSGKALSAIFRNRSAAEVDSSGRVQSANASFSGSGASPGAIATAACRARLKSGRSSCHPDPRLGCTGASPSSLDDSGLGVRWAVCWSSLMSKLAGTTDLRPIICSFSSGTAGIDDELLGTVAPGVTSGEISPSDAGAPRLGTLAS
mmetsp:Transcript_61521/g.141861  ORF Transcript_61521/g.141861 Transcript_61521/m.141861 type:complete len:316 (-) Transcript_61521:4-951(-)